MTDPTERRLHTRHRARTLVRIELGPHKHKLCRAVNLSATGVGIKTDNLGLRVGQCVRLTFLIDLNKVVKLHWRQARVTHIRGGITGMAMDHIQAK